MSCSWSTRATSEPAIVWEHFSESRSDLEAAFAGSGLLVPTRAASASCCRSPRRGIPWLGVSPGGTPARAGCIDARDHLDVSAARLVSSRRSWILIVP